MKRQDFLLKNKCEDEDLMKENFRISLRKFLDKIKLTSEKLHQN